MSTSLLNPLQPVSLDGKPAQQQRVLALATRLGAIHRDPEIALEVCAAFDMAAEFAACEGRSISEALTEFFAEAEPPTTRWGMAQADLRTLLGWHRHPIGRSLAKLPVLPSAAMKLLRISEESATVAQLESVAASDPVMAGRILGLANSVRFGSRYEITTISDSIQRVGIPEARKSLLSACFSGLFISRPLQEVWVHSQLVADFAWQFAALSGVDRGTAYSAGLLHDIGRLSMLCGPPQQLLNESAWLEAGFPLVYAETLARMQDHAAAGADLLTAWKLPDDLIAAVRLHHRPECTKSALTHILFLAEDLTAKIEQKAPEDLWTPMRRQLCLDQAGITAGSLNQVLATFTGDSLLLAS